MKLRKELISLLVLPFVIAGCSSPKKDSEEVLVDTCSLARDAEIESEVEVNGIVASVLQGQSGPCGYYLMDKTGSIYVHDTDNAPNLHVGENVHIVGTRTNYILETELSAAQKLGYEGAIQIDSVTSCTKNDEDKHELPLEGAIYSNIESILKTPLTNNITTQVFRVSALIKRVEGTGYVNYYFDDFDGKTGSYVYTQKNGSDYEWLDKYDNRFMDVLIAPHNVKCSGTGYNYRFTPISIIDEYKGSDQDMVENIARIIFYNQFENEYKADPSLELITSYNSDVLGESGFKATYTSKSDAVTFNNDVMHIDTSKEGKAKINVEIKFYDSKTDKDIEFDVRKITAADFNAKTCKEASDLALAGVGTSVTVRGIVASTMTNNGYGYYIVDESGLICVVLKDKDEFSKISVGNEVVLTGTTDLYSPNASTSHSGWARLISGVVEFTDFGNHPIDLASFKDATVDQLSSLAGDPNPSVNGYRVQAKIKIVGNNYYTNYYIADPTNDNVSVLLYAGNGKTVWGEKLDQYEGKVVELLYTPQIMKAANNWRGYVIQVLSVVE